jgi:hypothetical protein
LRDSTITKMTQTWNLHAKRSIVLLKPRFSPRDVPFCPVTFHFPAKHSFSAASCVLAGYIEIWNFDRCRVPRALKLKELRV